MGTKTARWRSSWLLAGVVFGCQISGTVAPASSGGGHAPAPAPGAVEPPAMEPPAVPAAGRSIAASKLQPATRRTKIKSRPGPPKIKHARLVSATTVRLAFTESLGPTDALDLKAFRLSVGMDYRYGRYAYAYYYDAGEAFSNYEASVVAAHRRAANELDLEFNTAFDPEMCEEMRDENREIKLEPGIRGGMALYLHYAPPPSGAVVDTSSDALAAVGPNFVTDRSKAEREFEGKAARKVLARLQRVSCDWN